MTEVIRADALTRVYQQGTVRVDALRGVSLAVSQGEFTALVGPSGSGKSTLLNLLGLLDSPTSGEVFLGNERVSGQSKKRAATIRLEHIGFVFQAYNLLPVLTAFENAEYTLLLQGKSADERRERVIPLLERMGLADAMNRRPHELSGGQQQRVAVCRAIAANPQLVLADEPTANLDRTSAAELLDLMSELNDEKGVTFVFASHDTLVMERARRVVTLTDGLVKTDITR